MNASRFALGLVALALAGLWYFAGGTQPLPVSRAAETPRVTPPLTHENLSVYFVYGPDTVPDAKVMTLNEALERNLAIVHETSDVNTLAVENKSPEYELFIQSGDIVKGGKQDRMAASDMLLPPGSGVVPLPAHCVEQGRWTGRGKEDSRRFASSEKFAAGKDLKYANAIGQQSAVWENVSRNQTKLNDNLKTTVNAAASPTSFQLTLEAPAVKASVEKYESALKAAGTDRQNIIGVVFVVNGQVTGAEVYGSNALFRKAWPKLLNAAAVEAVAESDKRAAAPPSAREIEYFLARAAEPEPARTAKTRTRLEVILEDTEVQLNDGQNINEIPLSELLQDLSNRYGVAFVIMEDYFTAEGMPKIKEEKPKLAVTRPRGQKLGNFLDIVLLSMNATFIVRPDHVEITTFERRMRDLRLPGQRIYQTPNSEMTAQGRPGSLWTIGFRVDVPTPLPPAGVANDNIGQPNVPNTNTGQTRVRITPPPVDGIATSPNRAGRIIIEGNEVTGNRVRMNQLDLRPGQAARPAPPANPSGNRLNSTRNENRSSLMVESRDPTRKNAVIHRSYIKK